MSHVRRPSSYDDSKSISLSSGHRRHSSPPYTGTRSSPASAAAELSYPPEDNSGALLDDSDIEMITLQASQPVSWSPSSPVASSSNGDLNSPSADVLSRSRNRLDNSRGPPRVSTRQPECRMEPEHHQKRDNTWVNPSTVYFQKISSSRLSPDTNVGHHTYRSPSAAMMDAVRYTRPGGSPNSVLNPVATHLGVPSIHPPILRTRPFASTNTL